jgi:hypothetical protein
VPAGGGAPAHGGRRVPNALRVELNAGETLRWGADAVLAARRRPADQQQARLHGVARRRGDRRGRRAGAGGGGGAPGHGGGRAEEVGVGVEGEGGPRHSARRVLMGRAGQGSQRGAYTSVAQALIDSALCRSSLVFFPR